MTCDLFAITKFFYSVLATATAVFTYTTLTKRERIHSVWVIYDTGEIWCMQPIDARPGHS